MIKAIASKTLIYKGEGTLTISLTLGLNSSADQMN